MADSNIEEILKQILAAKFGKDVRQAIHDGIEQCYEDGKVGAVDLVARQRIDNLAKLEEGSTTGDAELRDIRIGYDGTEYENAGEAVRGQIGSLSEELDNISIEGFDRFLYNDIIKICTFVRGKYIEIVDGTFKETENSAYNTYVLDDVNNYKRVKVTGAYGYDIYPAVFTDDSNKVVAYYPSERKTPITLETIEINVPNGAKKLYVCVTTRQNAEIYEKINNYKINNELKKQLEAANSVANIQIEGYSKSDYKDILTTGISQNGYYIELVDGNTNFKVTASTPYVYYKIPVTEGKQLKINGIYGYNIRPAVFVDENESLVSFYPIDKGTGTIVELFFDIIVPERAKYVLITGYKSTEIKCLEGGYLNFTKTFNNQQVKLYKENDKVLIKSMLNEKEMTISAYLHGSQNLSFCFEYYYLDGEIWKNANDDITPIYFNYSYRGGGHGDDRGYTINFSDNHGLTEANIGELWTDALGHKFLICKIISDNSILTCSPKDFVNSNDAPFNSYGNIQSPLSYGDKSIEFESAVRGQFAPIANNVSVKVILNNNEITENGEYTGEYVDILESYDLLYLPSMVQYLKDNMGNNNNSSMYSDDIKDKYCTVTNVYRFTERGAITLFQSIDWYKTVFLSFAGMIQSISIGNYYFVPLTNKKNISIAGTETVDFTPDTWDDENIPPNRFYQYSDDTLNKGICIGYNNEFGYTKEEFRKLIKSAGNIYGNSKKLYPHLIDISEDYDTSIYCISYRLPLYAYTENIPCVCWYYVGDDIYVLIDSQKTVDDYIPMPNKMIGMKIKIIESDGNVEVENDFVLAKGIKFKNTDYGSVILKLYK